jgi:hypothetical protein
VERDSPRDQRQPIHRRSRPVLPNSWQNAGSGVFALTLILEFGVLCAAPGRYAAPLAGLGALGAVLVDIYLDWPAPHRPAAGGGGAGSPDCHWRGR